MGQRHGRIAAESTAEDFDALSEAFSNQLLESLQKELNVQRRSVIGSNWSTIWKLQHGLPPGLPPTNPFLG